MSRKARRKKKKAARGGFFAAFAVVCVLLIVVLWPGGLVSRLSGAVEGGTSDVPASGQGDLPMSGENDVGANGQADDLLSAPTDAADLPTMAAPTIAPTAIPTDAPTPAPTPVSITITAAGDFTLGGDKDQGTLSAFEKVWKANEPEYYLKHLLPIFEADDLTVVNLEGPLTGATDHVNHKFVFKGRPSYAKILSAGSVELCNLANNHNGDYRKQGAANTKEALEAENVAYYGFDDVYVTTVKGVTIGFCGYRTMTLKESTVKKTIETLREQCDIVIASFHWGTELKYTPDKSDMKLGKNAIDAGADLVLGHHPHVVNPIEEYKGKYIVYSLGNCCFGGSRSPTDTDSILFQQTFIVENGEVQDGGISVIPISVTSSKKSNNYQPIVLEGADAERVFGKIKKASKGIENAVDVWTAKDE